MADVINQHVARLALYQPFDAHFAKLYAEYVDTNRSDELKTKALDFVRSIIDDPKTRMVVLTGDAGHGKTHLCGQVLSGTGHEGSVRQALAERCMGQDDLASLPSGRSLRVVKDLSELAAATATERLAELLANPALVTIVCANEGRLRQVVSNATQLEPIAKSLNSVLTSGATTADGAVHVIDLNHQSVAAPGGGSLVRQLLRRWVDDQRKWAPCDACDAREHCPIFENRRLLIDPVGSESRRQGLEMLLRVAEQTGHVITIRELLILGAHALTGGLTCEQVHDLRRRRKADDWQQEYLFHQTVFGTRLKPSDRDRLRVFRALAMLDPGQRALRQADDALVALEDRNDIKFVDVTPLERMNAPRNNAQKQRDASDVRTRYRYLRRLAYFDAATAEQRNGAGFAERIGLQHYHRFEQLFAEHLPPDQQIKLRDLVLRGLEAIQGLRGHSNPGAFVIVDPAFSASRGRASVVAVEIPMASVELRSQSPWWRAQGHVPNLDHVVDWVDRRVYVILTRPGATRTAVALDLRQFEFVCRASKGLSSAAFFQADIRRVMSQLAKATENPPPTYKISVVVDGRPAGLVLDIGGIIEAALA